jgi:hypothetical protein
MPDKFSKGCRECWGEKTEVFRTLKVDDEWLASLRGDQKSADGESKDDNSKGESMDGLKDAGEQTGGTVPIIAEPDQAEGEATSTTPAQPDIVPDKTQEDQKEATPGCGVPIWDSAASIAEPDQAEGEATSTTPAQSDIVPDKTQEDQEATPGWGVPIWDSAASDGWGAADGDDGWAMDIEKEGVEIEENPWASPEEDRSLEHLLGPTLVELPTTHTTAVVEQSLRRITDLIPIPTNLPPKSDEGGVDAAAIELELERMFPKVVLSPWLNWDGGEMPAYSDPRILDTSQGDVVKPPYATRKADDPPATPGVHDPGNDPITVLVHPSVFEKLIKGICVAGTWVQMVRKPVEPSASAPAAKKKKKGKKKAPANFWYVDEVAAVLPSYWTAPKA